MEARSSAMHLLRSHTGYLSVYHCTRACVPIVNDLLSVLPGVTDKNSEYHDINHQHVMIMHAQAHKTTLSHGYVN